ncbi:hypothetical protein DAPPUDRAFT_310532 [Daphnia pulex]|uniref:Uncharacterized protein n=1 Tax=Daphnia pulex TaxID=6669 RepID=E9FTX8_DAPPU|nr:hypothetical protein DAPPUDRAFT_310532 [Daphnia pulex]|eukprot:EFX89562.1 hypothetical protein DAPPUDRAFT_310532 [Daphnia pulex]
MRDSGTHRHQQERAENQQDNKTDNPLPVGDSQPQQARVEKASNQVSAAVVEMSF